MKKALMVLSFSATLALMTGSAQARHWRYCDSLTYADYSQSSHLSPWSYIYPVANWGPFFHCVRHWGPVIYPQRMAAP